MTTVPSDFSEPPFARVKVGDVDEVGVYYEHGWLRLLFYDHQGEPGTYPASMARALARALNEVADFRERVEVGGVSR